jgi:hypothetical protein
MLKSMIFGTISNQKKGIHMAQKKQRSAKFKPTAPEGRKVKKSYKAETLPFAELEEGQSVAGTFQGRKQITIRDRNTHEPKDIFIYKFMDISSGDGFAISGRFMLDEAFEKLAEELGGFDRLEGEDVCINRGEDEKTGGGNRMGTYEIQILEAD